MRVVDFQGSRLANCLVCHECDLLVDITGLAEGYRAQCPRCSYVLCNAHRNPIERVLIFSASALICLIMSCMFDFMELTTVGQVRDITLPETVRELFALHEWALAGFIGLIIIAMPVTFIAALVSLLLSIQWSYTSEASLRLLQFVGFLRFWSMAEIFFLGILISMVKIASSADLDIGTSFWFYALFNLFMICALSHVDKTQLALTIRRQLRERKVIAR